MYQPEFPLKMSSRDGPYKNIDQLQHSVKQNVLFLLNTSPGEWPAKPDLGVGVRAFLFENPGSSSWERLHQRIKEQFTRYMPFLNVESEMVTHDTLGNSLVDESTLKLVLRYTIIPLSINEVVMLGLNTSPDEQ